MLSKQLLGTLVALAAAVVVPGSAAAHGSDPATARHDIALNAIRTPALA